MHLEEFREWGMPNTGRHKQADRDCIGGGRGRVGGQIDQEQKLHSGTINDK